MLEKVSVKQTEKKSTGTFRELAVTGCCGCCICRFKRRLDKFKDANASLRDVDPNKRMRKEVLEKGAAKEAGAPDSLSCCTCRTSLEWDGHPGPEGHFSASECIDLLYSTAAWAER